MVISKAYDLVEIIGDYYEKEHSHIICRMPRV